AKIGLGLPVVKGAETCVTDPIMQTIQATVAKAKYFQLYYDQFLPADPAAASNDAVQELFAGTKTPAQVAQAVQDSYAAEIQKSGGAAPTAAPAASAKPVTINWYHISTADDQKAFYQKVANDYTAAHPNVTINITVLENEAFKAKMTTLMQAGTPPDLFQSWGGGVMVEYAKAGLLKDITADMAGGWGDTFGAGPLGVYAYNGKQYGAPRDMGEVGFWYNKDLFKQAGIASTPATWTDFLADVKKLQDAKITPIAVAAGDKWPAAHYWMWTNVRIGGQDAFNKAFSQQGGSFADPSFVKAGDALKQLIDMKPFEDGFLGHTYGDADKVFASGGAAIELMGQWELGSQASNSPDGKGLGDKLGWFPFPVIEGGAGDPADAMGGGNGWAVGKDAPPEAIDFLKALTSKDEQCGEAKIGLGLPVVKGAETCVTDPIMQTIQATVAKAKYFQLYYDQFLPADPAAASNDAVQELFAGTKTPAQVAQAVQDAYAAELKK
ncbi:MAG TPA: extracellular solute-binding protein, partial [Rhodocyclaceae bacterium]|nr:extracellular solute-binding protein [Rhodocyclaceae bacterium]